MNKECFKCHRILEITEFYRHKKMADGHLGKCKECTKSDVKTRYEKDFDKIQAYEVWRNKDPKRKARAQKYQGFYRKEHSEAYVAHSAVSNAIRNGRLIKPDTCSECGEKGKVHGHHENYENKLSVTWLCPLCHAKRKRK